MLTAVPPHLHEARLVRGQAAGGAFQLGGAVIALHLLDGGEAVPIGLRGACAVGRAVRARARACALAYYAPAWGQTTTVKSSSSVLYREQLDTKNSGRTKFTKKKLLMEQ